MKKKILFLITILVLLTTVSCTKKLEVTFISDDAVVKIEELKKGTTTKDFTISKEGYDFLGWYLNNEKFDFSTKINKSIVLNAKWELSVIKSNIKYELNGGTLPADAPTEYEEGIGLSSLPIPTKEGYVFLGWEIENRSVAAITSDETGEKTLTAIWEYIFKTYTINYELDGGVNEEGAPLSYLEGSGLPTLPTPTKEGYEFVGWSLNNKTVTMISSLLKEDITLTAIWKYIPKTFNITYQLEGGSNPTNVPTTYVEGTGVKTLPIPTQKGYDFAGWTINNEILTEISDQMKENVVLKATWTIKQFTYTFIDYNNNVLETQTKDYNSMIIAPANPTRAEDELYTYEFSGWDKEFSVLTENIIIKAQYTKTEKTIYYKVEFYGNNNEVYNSSDVLRNSTVEAISITKESDANYNYVFLNWCTDTELTKPYDFSTKITSNLKLYPSYSKQIKTLAGSKISFIGDSITTFYDPAQSMSSYYHGTNEFYYPKYSATIKNVDLTWWAQLLAKTATTLGINESLSGSTCYNWGSDTAASAAMNYGRINHIDDNGTPDIVVIYIGTNDVVSNFTVEQFENAYRTMVKRVKSVCPNAIIFVGTLGYSAYAQYDNALRTSYNELIREIAKSENIELIEFANIQNSETYGDILGDNLHPSANGATKMAEYASSMIKAYFNNNNTYYDIEYNFDGVSYKDPVKYISAIETLTLPVLTKEGYNFIGWNTKADFTGETLVKLENVSSNIKLFAQFELIPIVEDIKFVLNGGTWSSETAKYMNVLKTFELNSYDENFWTEYATKMILYPLTGSTINPQYSDRVVVTKDLNTGFYKVTQTIKDGDIATYGTGDYVIIISESHSKFFSLNLCTNVHVGDFIDFSTDLSTLVAGAISIKMNVIEVNLTAEVLENFAENFDLPTPVKAGSTFGGWYLTSDFTGNAVTKAEPGNTVYAKWN